MLVSVILPVYNSIEFLEDTINCVLSQTFTNFEFLISDDCSSDESLKLCLGYNDDRIKIYDQHTTLGAWRNHEFLLKKGKGKYLFIMGHDDLISENYIERLVDKLEKHDKAAFSTSTIYNIHYEGKYNTKHKLDLSVLYNKSTIETAKEFMLFPESGGKANLYHSLIRKEMIGKTGTFVEQFLFNPGAWGDDYLQIFKVLLVGNIEYSHDAVFYKRITSDSSNRWKGKDVSKLKKDNILSYNQIIKDSSLSRLDKEYLYEIVEIKNKQGIK